MVDVLVGVIIILLLTALAYWAAGLLGAPHPIPTVILVVGVCIAVLYLLSNVSAITGDLDDNDRDRDAVGFAL